MTRDEAAAAIKRIDDAAFVLVVCGAALTPWPFLVLFVGAAYLIGRAVLVDRRMPDA